MLSEWVQEGDFVLDIGANIGQYTCELSWLEGPRVRVIAFEPVLESFELLAANVAKFPHRNVTLLNVAASDRTTIVGMSIPRFDTGLIAYYRAAITEKDEELSVLCLAIDSLNISERIKFATIDVEGHEISVLKGMRQLLQRDHPILIIEEESAEEESEISLFLKGFGYSFKKLKDAGNRIYQCLQV